MECDYVTVEESDLPDNNQELKQVVKKLQDVIKVIKSELKSTLHKLEKAEKKKKKLEAYNDDLYRANKDLKQKLSKQKSPPKMCNIAIQVEMRVPETTSSLSSLQETDKKGADPVNNNPEVMPAWSVEDLKVGSIAECVKAAAEETLEESGVVFDDNSGMYYDYNTGYYFDPNRSLYYEPHSGTYYFYNTTSGRYEFHSQVDVAQYTEQQPCHQASSKRRHKYDQEDPPRQRTRRDKDKNPSDDHEKSKKRKRKTRDEEKPSREDKLSDKTKEKSKRKKRKKEKKDSEKMSKKKDSEKTDKNHDSEKTDKQKDSENTGKNQDSENTDKQNDSENTGKNQDSENTGKNQDSENTEKQSNGTTKSKDEEVTSKDGEEEVGEVKDEGGPDAGHQDEEMKVDTDETVIKEEVDNEVLKLSNSEDGEIADEDTETKDEDSEMEEGEISSSSSSSDSDDSSEDEELEVDAAGKEEALPTHWPPCIRAMVTSSDSLDEGTLFLVTCTGTTIGREESLGHGVLIPDTQVSKMHAEVRYDEEQRQYTIKDHASQNGTFVNDRRISEAKVMSETWPLRNHDVMCIGGTRLTLHIHPGRETCDDCEPGLVQAKLQAQQPKETVSINKEKDRRQMLNRIKKKYGLKETYYTDQGASQPVDGFEDKAAIRRKTKGSDNPHQKDDLPASVDRAISQDNKGHKMLAKMGWKEGQGLGKIQQGLSEPVQVNIRSKQSAGLGSAASIQHSLDASSKQVIHSQRWLKAQERFMALTGVQHDDDGADDDAPAAEVPTKLSTAVPTKRMTFVQGQTLVQNKDSMTFEGNTSDQNEPEQS